MDLLQSSRPRHPHSFHSQNHPRPALRVLIAFEVFGSIDPLQAFLDHFEPSHGSDYSMMMPRARVLPSMMTRKMLPLDRQRQKGWSLVYYVTLN